MNTQRASWYTKPTLKMVLIFLAIWLVGNFLIMLAATDFFQEPIQVDKRLPVSFLSILSTVSVIKVIRNYRKTQSTGNP